MYWRLCSTKQRIGKDRQLVIGTGRENVSTGDGLAAIMTAVTAAAIGTTTVTGTESHNKLITQSTFNIEIPQYGYYERQLEFRSTILQIQVNTN